MNFNIITDPELIKAASYKDSIKAVGTIVGDQLELFYIREHGIFKKTYEVKFAFTFFKKRATLGINNLTSLDEAILWAKNKAEEIFNW